MNGASLLIPAAVACSIAALAPPAAGQARGELLYTTNCKLCHSQQVHWRDNRLATDWGSLVAQVRRWQETGRLGWSDEDIRFVARYLNDSIYKFPETSDSLTLAPPLQGLAMRDLTARLAAGSPAAAHRSRPSP
jgi:hypothetical protein